MHTAKGVQGSTLGAQLEVSTHAVQGKEYCIEWVDVGGRSKSELSQRVFFYGANGFVIVHDLTNRKSYQNGWTWFDRASAYANGPSATGVSTGSNTTINSSVPYTSAAIHGAGSATPSGLSNRASSRELSIRLGPEREPSQLPVLVVGTKLDMVGFGQRETCDLAADLGGLFVDMTTSTPSGLPSNTSTNAKDPRTIIDQFLTQVIQGKYRPILQNINITGYANTRSEGF